MSAEFWITNHGVRDIARVEQRPCDDGGAGWTAVEAAAAPSGASRSVPLSRFAPCVDLRVLDDSGAVLGLQRGLRVVAGASWVIR